MLLIAFDCCLCVCSLYVISLVSLLLLLHDKVALWWVCRPFLDASCSLVFNSIRTVFRRWVGRGSTKCYKMSVEANHGKQCLCVLVEITDFHWLCWTFYLLNWCPLRLPCELLPFVLEYWWYFTRTLGYQNTTTEFCSEDREGSSIGKSVLSCFAFSLKCCSLIN